MKRIFVASMGRSGSSAITSKLTNENGYIFMEPFLCRGGNADFYKQLRSFGQKQWLHARLKKKKYRKDPARLVADMDDIFMSKFQYWGVKEVYPVMQKPTIDVMKPDHIIITVRNVRDVALSFLEKHIRQDLLDELDLNWIETYLEENTQILTEMAQEHKDRVLIIRHEDRFAGLDQELQKLGLTFNEEDATYFDKYNRQWEIERQKKSKGKPISMAERGVAPYINEEDIARIVDKCSLYNDFFDYSSDFYESRIEGSAS